MIASSFLNRQSLRVRRLLAPVMTMAVCMLLTGCVASDMMLSSVTKQRYVKNSKSFVLMLFHSKREPTISPMTAPSMFAPLHNYN